MHSSTNPDAPWGVRHAPTTNLATAEGRAIDDLYHAIRGRIEDSDGWNGGDVVELVEDMLADFGYGINSPYIPRETGIVHPAVVQVMYELHEADVASEIVPSDGRGRLLEVRTAGGGHIWIGAPEDIPAVDEEITGWQAQYYSDPDADTDVVHSSTDPDHRELTKALLAYVRLVGGAAGV